MSAFLNPLLVPKQKLKSPWFSVSFAVASLINLILFGFRCIPGGFGLWALIVKCTWLRKLYQHQQANGNQQLEGSPRNFPSMSTDGYRPVKEYVTTTAAGTPGILANAFTQCLFVAGRTHSRCIWGAMKAQNGYHLTFFRAVPLFQSP